MRVLVAEDELLLANAIAVALRRASVAVDVVFDGSAALELLGINAYDVLVLDRDLPRVHGDVVCRSVAADRPDTRVLMLTASGTLRDRVEGLALGADDYLPKPFAMVEMVARVRALGRRARPASPPRLERSGIVLDTARCEVFRDERKIPLSRKEFAVLEELLRADGAVVSNEDLLERAWDERIDPFTNVVRMTVMSLRRKLGAPPVVHTVTGVGYQIP